MNNILPFYNDDKDIFEIGVDEAGRGHYLEEFTQLLLYCLKKVLITHV